MSARSLRTLRTAARTTSLRSAVPRPASLAMSRGAMAAGQSLDQQRHLNTINADEVAHFSKLSEHWWDEKGEFGLLHRMNPERVEFIRQKVALDPDNEPEWTFEGRHQDAEREAAKGTGQWLKGMRCLDVGCGGGLLAETLARLGGDVLAIDATAPNIAIARTHASADPLLPYVDETGHQANTSVAGRLEYRHTSAEALLAAGEQFDLVCSMEVLEHVDQPGEFLKALGAMVKPGGHLLLSTISRTPLAQLLTLTMAEDVLRLVTPGTHHYHKFVRPEELRRFVGTEMGGLDVWEGNRDASDLREGEVGSTQGIIYDPLNGRWRLNSAPEGTWLKPLGELVNYMYHAKKRPVRR